MPAHENPSQEELERRERWFEEYCTQLDENSVLQDPEPGRRLACPCCRHLTLESRGFFEICPVCFWEDDGQDDHDAHNVRGGPNGSLSLEEGRRNYAAFGACDERSKAQVCAARPAEMGDVGESTTSRRPWWRFW